MTNIGSGLDAQFGMKMESVVGTQVTPDRFFEITDFTATVNPTYISSDGIRAGKRFKRIAQVGISKKTVQGDLTMPLTKKNMGVWMKLLMGSTASAALDGSSIPYKQVHIPGGTMRGLSATFQAGKPEAGTGTVQPFTYRGVKVTDWSVDINDGAETTLKLTFDGWDEDAATGLASASYVASNDTWNFADVTTFTLGGTPTTGGGEVTIGSATAVTSVVKSFSLKGALSLTTDRYGVGNAGIKKEQIEKDFMVITGEFSGEFDKTAFYTPFAAGTTVPIQIDHVGVNLEAGKPELFSIIIPAAKLSAYSADVSGTDIVSAKGTFTVYDDEANAPLQIKIRSTDTTP
jgi:hypothetical protein